MPENQVNTDQASQESIQESKIMSLEAFKGTVDGIKTLIDRVVVTNKKDIFQEAGEQVIITRYEREVEKLYKDIELLKNNSKSDIIELEKIKDIIKTQNSEFEQEGFLEFKVYEKIELIRKNPEIFRGGEFF